MAKPVAFTNEGVDFKAFPETGSYFGVDENGALLCIPMSTDGVTWYGEEVCEVSNMQEAGDDKLLESINAEFGTKFRQADFAGR